jgi:hypothetical protein
LIITDGPQKYSYESSCNLFKPSARKDDFGLVISERLKETGIVVSDNPLLSKLVCNPCGRKLKNLSETYTSVIKVINDVSCSTSTDQAAKRKISVTVTPDQSSPNNKKSRRNQSPTGKTFLPPASRRKSLFPVDKDIANKQSIETTVLSKLLKCRRP